MARPFWKEKSLDQMNQAEWESLCDGCGRCCLVKLEDEETGEVYNTKVACQLLDIRACRCENYNRREILVPSCVILSPSNIAEIDWMPKTCAYRLLAEGKDLYDWHPLITGDPESVHRAGISVRDKVISERDISEAEVENYIDDSVDKSVDE